MSEEKKDQRVWAYGPEGEAQIFDSKKEVPDGWKDTPAAFELDEDSDDVSFDNQELRDLIEEETGEALAKNTSRKKLVEKYKELVGE